MWKFSVVVPQGIEMVSVCTGLLGGGRSCEHFGGYKTINQIPLSSINFKDTVLVQIILIFSLYDCMYASIVSGHVFHLSSTTYHVQLLAALQYQCHLRQIQSGNQSPKI